MIFIIVAAGAQEALEAKNRVRGFLGYLDRAIDDERDGRNDFGKFVKGE